MVVKRQWIDLPKELLESIAKCLRSPVDILRLRSVCSSWRSSVSSPSFNEPVPRLTLKLPDPINEVAVLSQSTVYRTEFAGRNSDFHSSSSSVSNRKGWLVKIGESTNGRLAILHPLTDYKIRYYPRKLNLQDYLFIQLGKAFKLQSLDGLPVYGINKVVLFPASAMNRGNDFAIIAIFHDGKLGYWKFGDEKFTLLDETNFEYDDIIEYKGQFYVVDRWGTVSWIDSSLRLIQYSPSLFGCGELKNLVESDGNLYIVDWYLEKMRATWKDYEMDDDLDRICGLRKCTPNAIDFKVYKLDEEWGNWVNVKSLGDKAFVLGADCSFSVSCDEYVGGKRNCIYFTDDDDFRGRGLSNDGVRVFRMEDGVIEKFEMMCEYSSLFWPPKLGQGAAEEASRRFQHALRQRIECRDKV